MELLARIIETPTGISAAFYGGVVRLNNDQVARVARKSGHQTIDALIAHCATHGRKIEEPHRTIYVFEGVV